MNELTRQEVVDRMTLKSLRTPDVIAALPRIIERLKQADGESWAVGEALQQWLDTRPEVLR